MGIGTDPCPECGCQVDSEELLAHTVCCGCVDERLFDLRQLLETAVDAFECAPPAIIPQGANWKFILLNRDWYEAAKKLTTTED
jgi:hypothetical protein